MTIECASCKARRLGLCQAYAEDLPKIVESCKVGERTLRAGESIFDLGDPCRDVYTIIDGWAYLFALRPDGGRQVLHYAMTGDFIGYHPGHDAMITYGAQVLTDTTVCVMSRTALENANRTHPGVGMRLAWLMTRNLTLSYDHLTSIARQNARERIAHLLLQLYIRRRTRWPEARNDLVELPLTQELIADTLGLTPVHVNRMLASLRKEGVLHFKLGRMRVLDPDKLVDIAGLDDDVVSNWIEQQTPPPRARVA
jgi:CRP-like cAMP-binding protein